MYSRIYELSWNDDSFLGKLELLNLSKKYTRSNSVKTLREEADLYSKLSSTYYSIAGTAFAKLKTALRPRWLAPLKVPFRLHWLLLGAYCYQRMLPSSERVVELIGYKLMTADQCDVRQSILWRCGFRKEAKECIEWALNKPSLKTHTWGLLLSRLADISLREGHLELAKIRIQGAIQEAKKAKESEPRQAARIYRYCGEIMKTINLDPALHLLREAQKLMKASGAQDQLLKMKN